MELKHIRYTSAVFFGAVTFLFTLIFGFFMWMFVRTYPDVALQYGVATEVGFFATVILSPIIYGIIYTVIGFAIIGLYNLIAKKYPISWEINR